VLAARKFLRNLKVWTWDFQSKFTSDGEWAPCVFLALARKNSSSVFFFFFHSIIDSWKILECYQCWWEKILSCFFCFCQLLILGRSISISVPGWKTSMHGAGGICSPRMAFFAVLCTEFWVIDRFLIYILLIENVINCYGRC